MTNNPAFNQHAQLFTEIFSSRRNPSCLAQKIKNILHKFQAYDILDIGCGGGDLTNAISNYNFKIVGIDNSQNMIDNASRNFKQNSVVWICEDFFTYEFDSRFDAAYAVYSFFQTLRSRHQQDQFLQKIKKILKPEGICILEVQNAPVITKMYPYNRLNEWESNGYTIRSISQEKDRESYYLKFSIFSKKTNILVAEFIHVLRFSSFDILNKIFKQNRINCIEWLDKDFSSVFDKNNSEGIVCILRC